MCTVSYVYEQRPIHTGITVKRCKYVSLGMHMNNMVAHGHFGTLCMFVLLCMCITCTRCTRDCCQAMYVCVSSCSYE